MANFYANYKIVSPVVSDKFKIPETPEILFGDEDLYVDFLQSSESPVAETSISNDYSSWINPSTVARQISVASPQTSSINTDIDIEDLLKQEGITTINGKKIVFGDRNVRDQNSNIGAKNSHHKRKNEKTGYANARDISIEGGTTDDYAAFRKLLLNNNNVRSWMSQNKWGIINEITPEILASTNGTGNHFHFGPDQWALQTWDAWMNDPEGDITINHRIKSAKIGTKLEADNIRQSTPIIIEVPERVQNINKLVKEKAEQEERLRRQGQIYDLDLIDQTRRNQSRYNDNALFGSGIEGIQTNVNPYTLQGQNIVQDNIDYAYEKGKIAAETLLSEAALAGAVEGARAAYRYLTYPRIIGRGGESVVISSRISPYVKGITTKSAEEIEELNKYPWIVKREVLGQTRNGLTKYRAYKVRPFKKHDPKLMADMNETILRESPELIEYRIEGMSPEELAYLDQNGNVINDIWASNIGSRFGEKKVFDATTLLKDDFDNIVMGRKGLKFK